MLDSGAACLMMCRVQSSALISMFASKKNVALFSSPLLLPRPWLELFGVEIDLQQSGRLARTSVQPAADARAGHHAVIVGVTLVE